MNLTIVECHFIALSRHLAREEYDLRKQVRAHNSSALIAWYQIRAFNIFEEEFSARDNLFSWNASFC
ncbi:MAG: hypothetical protein EOO77_20195 [Oxalobacteraceae bacterium]|nr:MAG: hypothetical protein EOO77_20195 [Oxalobacteraceae bacterium]